MLRIIQELSRDACSKVFFHWKGFCSVVKKYANKYVSEKLNFIFRSSSIFANCIKHFLLLLQDEDLCFGSKEAEVNGSILELVTRNLSFP